VTALLQANMFEESELGRLAASVLLRGTARLAMENDMPANLVYYALILIVIAVVAALLGFGGLASTAMSGAHLFVWLAVVILVIGVVFALMRRV
jgi:uncharacterized membrane protein YtjA (UPF0391 family)